MNSAQSNQLIFLNSAEATSRGGGVDDFIFSNELRANRGNRIFCEVREVEMPVSWYLIDSTNNVFTINVNSFTHSITLDSKNYNITQLLTELHAKFASASFNLTATFDSQTNKVKFVLTDTSDFTSLSIHESSTCLKLLGFVNNQVGTVNGTTAEITSQNCINLNRTLNVYIKTNLKLDNINSKGEVDGTIAKIHVDQPSGGLVHYKNIDNTKFMLANKSINHLEISLEDDEGRILELNGLDYHITFNFQYGKEQLQEYVETFFDKIKQIQDNTPESDTDSD